MIGIVELKGKQSNGWLEIEYTGAEIVGNLGEMLDESLADSGMEIRRIKNKRVVDRVINSINEDETLDDLDVHDVFTRCLDTYEVTGGERDEMIASYREIITSLDEEDVNAE